jgi:hypothetical protein
MSLEKRSIAFPRTHAQTHVRAKYPPLAKCLLLHLNPALLEHSHGQHSCTVWWAVSFKRSTSFPVSATEWVTFFAAEFSNQYLNQSAPKDDDKSNNDIKRYGLLRALCSPDPINRSGLRAIWTRLSARKTWRERLATGKGLP